MFYRRNTFYNVLKQILAEERERERERERGVAALCFLIFLV